MMDIGKSALTLCMQPVLFLEENGEWGRRVKKVRGKFGEKFGE
jgi:hypothetical protein